MQSKPTKLAEAVAIAATTFCVVAAPMVTSTHTAGPSPQPGATPTTAAQETPAAAAETDGGFDISKLRPEQQEALRLAVIK